MLHEGRGGGGTGGGGGGRKRGHVQRGTPEKAPGSRAKDEVGQILSTWVLEEMLSKEAVEVRAWRRGVCSPWKRWFQHLTPSPPPHTHVIPPSALALMQAHFLRFDLRVCLASSTKEKSVARWPGETGVLPLPRVLPPPLTVSLSPPSCPSSTEPHLGGCFTIPSQPLASH